MADTAIAEADRADREPAEPAPRRRAKWRRAAAVLGLLAVLGIGAWWWYSGDQEVTDDAQVDGNVIPIAAKVGGIVIEVAVEDNQHVEGGTVLAMIDRRDYEVAVARAEGLLLEAQAALAAAEAGVPLTSATTASKIATATAGQGSAAAGTVVAERQVDAARAQVTAARARRREAEIRLRQAAQDVERLRPLAEKDEISRQHFDAVRAAEEAAQAAADSEAAAVLEAETAIAIAENRLAQARGELTQAGAAVSAARTAPQQVAITRARVSSAQGQLAAAEAALRQAKLNLEYTTIRAPSSGVVSRKSAEPGQIVQPGQPLMALVPLREIWVTANYKETQLQFIRPGQRAEVTVDAYGGRTCTGTVQSVAPATGARFSLLPPDNASGNYVKVVQRVPVRIALDSGQDVEHVLRPGMSVTARIFTR